MRTLVPAIAAVLLAACSGGDKAEQAQAQPAPAPSPTGPAPRTPVLQNVSPEPGASPTWMAPRPNPGDPKTAPFANTLDQPVVDAPGK